MKTLAETINGIGAKQVLCLNCGGPRTARQIQKQRPYCSMECWRIHKAMPSLTCPTCGDIFKTYDWKKISHCSFECSIATRIRTLKDRFIEKISIGNDCWLWLGGVLANTMGYGQIGIGGRRDRKTLLAHRVSYELFIGPIPSGLQVLHECDNPPCVRPRHLFLGTQLDNMKDMMNKGRGRYVNVG